ncbi:MAG: hypothetical protein ACFFDN_02160 [Candidatus Hodarchaeota archaeon]
MGIDNYKIDLYLQGDLDIIYEEIKAWLITNKFKFKEEIKNSFINAYTGGYFAFSDSATRRWMEINLKKGSNDVWVHIYEKVMRGGTMDGNLIKEEVMELTNFLTERFPKIKREDRLVSKEIIIKERVKIIYELPQNCPNCKVNLKYEEVIMKGPNKVQCAYCNSLIDLIEKEI